MLEVLGLGYVPVTVGGALGERAWSVPVRQAVRRAVAAVLYTAAGQECCGIGNAGARATLNVSFYIFGHIGISREIWVCIDPRPLDLAHAMNHKHRRKRKEKKSAARKSQFCINPGTL